MPGKKIIQYILLLLAVVLAGYKSVYFKKLSEVQKAGAGKFDAVSFSKKLWDEKLPAKLDSAIGLEELIRAIEANPADAFTKYSHAMSIGNYRYSLVKAEGIAAAVNQDDIVMQISHADSLMTVKLATEYIYGNAIRDASGLLDIRDFSNTMDLNNISEELNKTVRGTIIPPFRKQIQKGNRIAIIAAVELNKEHIKLNGLELIPLRLKILP